MTTATRRKRTVTPEAEQAYAELVKQLGNVGESVDVTQHQNILARARRSDADLLGDVEARRKAVRSKAREQLREAERLQSEDVAQADADKMREFEELNELEAECEQRIADKRSQWMDARQTADTAQRKANELKRTALRALSRTCDPSLQSQIAELEAERQRIVAELDVPSVAEANRLGTAFKPKPITDEQRSANLARQAEIQGRIDELKAKQLEPEAIAV